MNKKPLTYKEHCLKNPTQVKEGGFNMSEDGKVTSSLYGMLTKKREPKNPNVQ